MFQETKILEETIFNKQHQQPVVCVLPVPLRT